MNGLNYAEAVVKARRYQIANEAIDEVPVVEENKNIAQAVLEMEAVPGTEKVDKKIGGKIAASAKKAGEAVVNFAKEHPGKAAAIGAGAAAAGAATAIAAKKIADKKKAAKQEEVKENYEYEEYESLVENVINYFMSDEEIMSENANQIAMDTADFLINNIDNM